MSTKLKRKKKRGEKKRGEKTKVKVTKEKKGNNTKAQSNGGTKRLGRAWSAAQIKRNAHSKVDDHQSADLMKQMQAHHHDYVHERAPQQYTQEEDSVPGDDGKIAQFVEQMLQLNESSSTTTTAPPHTQEVDSEHQRLVERERRLNLLASNQTPPTPPSPPTPPTARRASVYNFEEESSDEEDDDTDDDQIVFG